MTGLGGWENPPKTPLISNKSRLSSVLVLAAPPAAGFASPLLGGWSRCRFAVCVGLGLACLSSSWRLRN